jgi:hypothetical protein
MATWATISPATVLAVDTARNCVWFCQPDGFLRSASLDEGEAPSIVEHTRMGEDVTALAVNKSFIVTVARDGTLALANPDDIGGTLKRMNLGISDVRQIALLGATTSTLGIVAGDSQSLIIAAAEGGNRRDVGAPMISGITVVEGDILISANVDNYERGEIFSLQRSNILAALARGLPRVDRICAHPSAGSAIALHSSIGCVSAIYLINGTVKTYGPVDPGAHIYDI